MTWSCWRLLAALLLLLLATVFARGQDAAVNRFAGLPQIVRAAGIIFSGRVTYVGRASGRAAIPLGQHASSTAITFQVEHAIRGVSAGQILTIHEWVGLWACGERYRVGERVLLFLYPPSRLGLTSPVAAGGARFAIDPHDQIVMTPRNVATFAPDGLIGGKTRVPYSDFARAVLRASGDE